MDGSSSWQRTEPTFPPTLPLLFPSICAFGIWSSVGNWGFFAAGCCGWFVPLPDSWELLFSGVCCVVGVSVQEYNWLFNLFLLSASVSRVCVEACFCGVSMLSLKTLGLGKNQIRKSKCKCSFTCNWNVLICGELTGCISRLCGSCSIGSSSSSSSSSINILWWSRTKELGQQGHNRVL